MPMQSGAQPVPRFLITTYAAGVRINREIRAKTEADEKAAASGAETGDDGAKKTAEPAVSRFSFFGSSTAAAAAPKDNKPDFLL